MSYEHMNTAGFHVVLRLPDEIPPEQAIKELRTCITFGQAEVSLAWVLPEPDSLRISCPGPESDSKRSAR